VVGKCQQHSWQGLQRRKRLLEWQHACKSAAHSRGWASWLVLLCQACRPRCGLVTMYTWRFESL
jgi:hypothetical protein